MATAQAMPMPTFVARCLEEIGLEGRCGLPVRDMFALVDDAGDIVYRKFAWKVLRAMGGQIAFHYMLRRPHDGEDTEAATAARSAWGTGAASNGGDVSVRREKRRRKWSTTLLPVDEGNPDHATKARGDANEHHADEPGSRHRKRRRRRVDTDGNASSGDSENDDTSDVESESPQNERSTGEKGESVAKSSSVKRRAQHLQRLSDRSSRSPQTRSPQSRSHIRSRSSGPSGVSPSTRSQQVQDDSDTADSDTRGARSNDETGKDEPSKWLYRSPRGYELGEELDVTGLSYEDAISETPEGVLGIVACEELRLKYLGVVDPSGIDTSSPQYDLLELIGRTREQGLNAAIVAETGRFGDARKLHYLLDLLIACNFVVKNIVSADQKRFNILHLTRFVHHFHPSMISPTATFEKDSFPKEQLPHMIARILRSRGERTCVFADIGRELGYGKRHQEKLRKYFFHQMHIDANFPLELFMARCNTGSDTKGRKLWCVRLRSTGRQPNARKGGNGDGNFPGSGPVIERGIMEQMFASIHDREEEGATIPELRDVLGVPTFKLPYKLAQGLISNYNLGVEQVVLGKSTMYRMFAPGVVKGERDISLAEADVSNALAEEESRARDEVDGRIQTKEGETVYQPSTLKEATRGLVVASTAERRRQYILERVNREKIVSIHQLRSGLIEIERPKGKPVPDVGLIDIRSVRRIVDELVAADAIVTIDITLPPKRVLQKGHKMVKCVALPEAQRDREILRSFIDGYLEEQHRKFLEGLDHENDAFIVVSNRVNKKMSKSADSTAFMKENENKEIVKYTAASYKLARVHLVMLHKQGRRLGMYFGIMYRCKALHLLMWDRVPSLFVNPPAGPSAPNGLESSNSTGRDVVKTSVDKKNYVFALKEILDLLTVQEYIQIVGVSEVLTEHEENKVRMAIARGDSWSALDNEIVEKIRGCEADRFSRVLRVLIELGLVQVVNDSSHDLLRVMRKSTEDFDQVISQVAFATLSGGLFLLKDKARILLKRGNKLLKQLPHKNSYVYAAGFSDLSRSDQVTGRIPLDYTFSHIDDAKAYWKSLKFLALEGARLGSGVQDGPGGNMNVDPELVRPAPLRDHNLYAMKVWVPRATTNYRAITERAKAAADAVGDDAERSLKRKRYHSVKASRVSGRAEKVQRRDLAQVAVSAYRNVEGDDTGSDSGAGWRQMDGWGGAKSRVRAVKWSSEQDVTLMNLFIEKLSHQWFIDVPLALQKRDERVAFRTTSLSRTRISWKVLSNKLGRKREDCMLRVRELMTVPAIQARVENTKLAMTRAKNPGGEFHEELAVLKQPKLTALLCRALQIIFHERASYYSVLADMLISSHWKEAEVKLVWRYLWLGSVITRTKASDGKGHKQRGFCMHSHVTEMKSLQIPNYTMEFFCDAAEYASFLQQNVEEAELVADALNPDFPFEQEVEVNAPSGQIAIDLTAMVMTTASYIPEFSPCLEDAQDIDDTGKPSKKLFTPSLQESKRSLAIKGFAGHLSKRFDGASPDDFLKDFWAVKAQYRTNAGLQSGADSAHSSQAFSACAERSRRISYRRNDGELLKFGKWLLSTLEAIGRNGATLGELKARFKSEHAGRECDTALLHKAIDTAVSKKRCFEVNGSDAVRLVAACHASMWTLNPFRIGDDSTTDKVHFVFDKGRPVVSKPWLHLDGSVNATIALMFKRRIVNIVMCSPGIPDHAIHQKMHRALTLQDTRSLLDELLEEDLIYARASRSSQRTRKPRSIFDIGRREPATIPVFSWSPGLLRALDNDRDQLFFFPSVNCIELLGAAVSDADIERNE